MKKIFEAHKGKIVRLSDSVVGILIGFTEDAFIILLEENCNPIYSFTLEELGKEFYYIDSSFEDDCDGCYYAYANEDNIVKRKV